MKGHRMAGRLGRLAGVTLDVHDLETTKLFWAAVLGTEIEYEDDNWVAFARENGDSGLCLQRVPETKTVKNRSHMDIRLDDYEGGLERLGELGATVLQEVAISVRSWTVMTDPEGNEFCAIGPDRPQQQ